MIEGWEPFEDSMGNHVKDRHVKDRHVLAAAVRGHADVIVTLNLRDFPSSACEHLDIEIQHPDTFLCYELEQAPDVILQVLREQAAATGKPPHLPMSLEDVLSSLENCGTPVFAATARSLLQH